jgi:RimJ/RimL family protein N-acetyltransferase
MTTPIEIRQVSEGDAAELLRYLNELKRERLPTLLNVPKIPTIEEEQEWVRQKTQPTNCTVLLALCSHKIVGVLEVRGNAHPQQKHVAQVGISISKEFRSQGAGAQLMRAGHDWAGQHGIHQLQLEVLSTNIPAIRFYERLGYRHEGRRLGAVSVSDGYVDVVLMAHSLALPAA